MGKVKSIRFNEQTERMFDVIKSYYSERGGITDSEIISNGIREQYAVIVENLDNDFKEMVLRELGNKKELSDFFCRICDLLEVLSTTQGTVLEDEFNFFLAVILEDATISEADTDSKERFGKNAQYEKVWEKVVAKYNTNNLDKELLNRLGLLGAMYKLAAQKK